ncbi:hypothetical protein A2U01_0044443, partial [Trifolium medium]|nr:hypothetical protein [Trifolium medium]
LGDKSADKKKKKKKQKRAHSTSEHSKEEEDLPKNLGASAKLDASKEPIDRISDSSKDPNPAKKNDPPLSFIAEEVSPDKMVQTIVQELTQEHQDQDSDKTSSPQNAGEHQGNSKQPSPPTTNETPREMVDKEDKEKPVHTSPNKPATSQEKVDDEMNVGLKQDEHQFNP